MNTGTAEPGFGIYIHWPFCAQKCPYCDFNSHVRFEGWDEARFRAAYLVELGYVAERTGRREVSSIFFGGGTPSLMQPRTTAAILERIAALFPIAADAEVTIEANPGSVEASRFAGYRAAGVNRVSMGFQSLRDEQLKRLGRIHTVAEAKSAFEIARRTFARHSFDLIYARPGQTAEEWRTELAEALTLAGDHVSLYQLTIEPDTPYAALAAAGKLRVPDPDAALALYEITQEMTAARGLAAYEISNHARAGQESRHNLLYWRYGSYAGIGPGAHGRLLTAQGRVATVAERHPETWVARVEEHGHGLTEELTLSPAEQGDEMLLMGLRLSEGVDLVRLRQLSGVTPDPAALAELAGLGLLRVHAPSTSEAASLASANWRGNELDPIAMCAGPGLAPDPQANLPSGGSLTAAPGAPATRISATPRGRFVLNALVAKLSASFKPASGVDKLSDAR